MVPNMLGWVSSSGAAAATGLAQVVGAAVVAVGLTVVVAGVDRASACEGVECVALGIGQGAHDTGVAIGKGAEAVGRAVTSGAHGLGVTVEKGAQATGRGVDDVGRGADRAVNGQP